MEPENQLHVRVHGSVAESTLIYLPGLHGDWTLVAGFRRALNGRLRFVEVTYPRTLTWSLDEYAAAVEKALASIGITSGWLLGESYGSQIVWAMASRKKFVMQGIILAGGFARHPLRAVARMIRPVSSAVPMSWLNPLLRLYTRVARFRYRHSPEVRSSVDEFIARRTPLDKQAAEHRLQLIAENDPGLIARQCSAPIYALTGSLDPIVPWLSVKRWLKGNCPSLRDYKVIWQADHNVLGTAPARSAEQILEWIKKENQSSSSPQNPRGGTLD